MEISSFSESQRTGLDPIRKSYRLMALRSGISLGIRKKHIRIGNKSNWVEGVRLEMVNEMQNEILNGGEILFNQSKSRISNSSVSRGTNSNWVFEFLCISRYKFKFRFWVDLNLQLAILVISSPSRISFCIPMTISSLILSGTGCTMFLIQLCESLNEFETESIGVTVQELGLPKIGRNRNPVVSGTGDLTGKMRGE